MGKHVSRKSKLGLLPRSLRHLSLNLLLLLVPIVGRNNYAYTVGCGIFNLRFRTFFVSSLDTLDVLLFVRLRVLLLLSWQAQEWASGRQKSSFTQSKKIANSAANHRRKAKESGRVQNSAGYPSRGHPV